MKKDEDWKEYWRKNSPTIQKMRREARNTKIFVFMSVSFLAFIIIFIAIKKPNLDILDNNKIVDRGAITFRDNLFISAIEDITELYDEDTLDYNKIDKAIKQVSLISVSSIFEDLYICTVDELELINPINPINNNYDELENRNNYAIFANGFFDNLENVLLENNKEYTRKDNRIEYKYRMNY